MTNPDFDFSDVVALVDGLEEILDVAIDVLRDYGDAPGDSRIERLARWAVFNLSACARLRHRVVGNVSDSVTEDGRFNVKQVGYLVGVDQRAMLSSQARQLAAALLICADRADALT
jgi:hypothetical protein